MTLRYVLMQDPDPDDAGLYRYVTIQDPDTGEITFVLGETTENAEPTTFRFTETARRIKARLLKLVYKLELATWAIFDDVVTTGELTLDAVPDYPVKYAVTLSAIEGHTICTGSVTVGSEVLSFDSQNRLVTASLYEAKPIISTADLDCNAKVECVTEFGEIIEISSLTPMMVLHFPKTRIIRDPSGSGSMQTDYDMFATNTSLKIGDQILLSDPFQDDVNHSIYIKNEMAGIDLGDNAQHFRFFNCA